MTTPALRRPARFAAALLMLLAATALLLPGAAGAADTPRRGGVLLAVIGADPPSLDPHQESTFANIELVAPLYSTLLQLDPYSYPKIIGDVAVGVEGLSRRAHLHVQDPPGDPVPRRLRHDRGRREGDATTRSCSRPRAFAACARTRTPTVERIEAPDPSTVVFKLKFPSASLLANLASPWNVIFPEKVPGPGRQLLPDPCPGLRPFKFKSYTRGSTFEGERNPDYFVKDRPYLDGYKFYISPETSVRAAAIRSGRAYIEFRQPAHRRGGRPSSKQLGDKVAVQETPMTGQWGIAVNSTSEAVQRRPRPQGPHPRPRPLHHEPRAVPAHRTQGRRRAHAPGHGVVDGRRRAAEASRVLA